MFLFSYLFYFWYFRYISLGNSVYPWWTK